MKKTVVAGLLLCSASQALSAEKTYVVQNGDSISSVIQRHLSAHYNRSIALFSKEYVAAMEEFVAGNAHIKNIDLIISGSKIKLPQFTESHQQVVHEYQVKRGDSLWKLSRDFYPSLKNPFEGIAKIKLLNPKLRGDVIYTNKFLTLPVVPESKLAKAHRIPAQFLSNDALDDEIYLLSKSQSQDYTAIFRKITQAQDRAELKAFWKRAIILAQTQGHFHLEEAFIELTAMLIKPSTEDYDIQAIQDFFVKWKRLRREKNRPGGE